MKTTESRHVYMVRDALFRQRQAGKKVTVATLLQDSRLRSNGYTEGIVRAALEVGDYHLLRLKREAQGKLQSATTRAEREKLKRKIEVFTGKVEHNWKKKTYILQGYDDTSSFIDADLQYEKKALSQAVHQLVKAHQARDMEPNNAWHIAQVAKYQNEVNQHLASYNWDAEIYDAPKARLTRDRNTGDVTLTYE